MGGQTDRLTDTATASIPLAATHVHADRAISYSLMDTHIQGIKQTGRWTNRLKDTQFEKWTATLQTDTQITIATVIEK